MLRYFHKETDEAEIKRKDVPKRVWDGASQMVTISQMDR